MLFFDDSLEVLGLWFVLVKEDFVLCKKSVCVSFNDKDIVVVGEVVEL